ncbi:MAG: hypothetical protein M1833_000735 [Piccolia ochrophora]|nr:MAG: hypothetical protein M1833_000735 [Piccolia ochrophora]
MATEPRLEALLDEPVDLHRAPPKRPELQLPPLQDPVPPQWLSRPLPLEPSASASANGEVHTKSSKLSTKQRRSGPSTKVSIKPPTETKADAVPTTTDDAVPLAATQVTDASSTIAQSTFSDLFRREGSLQDGSSTDLDDLGPLGARKRHKIGQGRIDFVQLPKLPQKKTRPARMPEVTVLNGLKTPPPNAALFPPIAPGPLNEGKATDAFVDQAPASNNNDTESSSMMITDASFKYNPRSKPRKKWSEQETEDLMQGVAIYGVGNWKRILKHEGFSFNARSSIDLKDRFRTCCPKQYREHLKSASSKGSSQALENSSPSTPPREARQNDLSNTTPSPMTQQSPRGSRSAQLDTSDLERLGLSTPFPSRPRRSRRAFTPGEDSALLRGYMTHGPAWSRIQSDPRLELEGRRATDLRDRFRNRFPEKYAEAGFKTRLAKPPSRTEGGFETMEDFSSPEAGEALSNRLQEHTSEPAQSDTDLPADDPPLPSLMDWDEHTLPPFGPTQTSSMTHTSNGGVHASTDNDLSRLLLSHISPLLTTYTLPSYSTHLPSKSPSAAAFPLLGRSDGVTSSGMTSTRKPSVNLPPPTDLLLPMDFDPGPSFGTKVDKKGDSAVQGVLPLLWEDMATHPIFDLDADGPGNGGARDGSS